MKLKFVFLLALLAVISACFAEEAIFENDSASESESSDSENESLESLDQNSEEEADAATMLTTPADVDESLDEDSEEEQLEEDADAAAITDVDLSAALAPIDPVKEPELAGLKITTQHYTKVVGFPVPNPRYRDTLPETCDRGYLGAVAAHVVSHSTKKLEGNGVVKSRFAVKGCGTFNPKYFLDNKHTHTQAEISINDNAKYVTISFRGTEVDQKKDIMTDLKFKHKICIMGANVVLGKIHKGFCKSYRSIRARIIAFAKAFLDAGYNVHFTGSSLGGALANLALLDFHKTVGGAKIKDKAFGTTFGSPRTGLSGEYSDGYRDISMQRYVIGSPFGMCNDWGKMIVTCGKNELCLSEIKAKYYETMIDNKIVWDLVPSLPPKKLGCAKGERWVHVGTKHTVQCYRQCSTKKSSFMSNIKRRILCHYSPNYVVGIQFRGQPITPPKNSGFDTHGFTVQELADDIV